MKPASFEKAEWIDPWRDRRPMTEDPVLVTTWRDGKTYVECAWYREKHNYDTITYEEGWVACGTVLAWKPLEEPYDPTAEEEEKPFADAVTVTIYPMDKEAGYEN